MTLRSLLAGCFLSHDFIRDRNQDGTLILKCQTCSAVRVPLQQDPVRGPAHVRVEARGVPITRVQRQSERTRRYPRMVS